MVELGESVDPRWLEARKAEQQGRETDPASKKKSINADPEPKKLASVHPAERAAERDENKFTFQHNNIMQYIL